MNYQIISEIAVKAKSQIYLITIDNKPEFYVLKKYTSEAVVSVIEHIKDLPKVYFPSIVEWWSENGEVYLIEEYIAGKTLRDMIKDGNLTFAEIMDYMIMLCDAMDYLHCHVPKLVHRDIKPENIIIDKEKKLKLIDFDALRCYKSGMECDTVLMGTRNYAPPEQFGFRQTDERSDIYSAGTTLLELHDTVSTGKWENAQIQKIVDKATRFEPDKRYQNAKEMKKDLQKIQKRKVNWEILCIIAAAIVIAGGVLWCFGQGQKTYDDGTLTEETYARNGELYHRRENACAFWGFLDGYEYPEVFYLEEQLEGYPITLIDDYALAGKEKLRELHVPASVTAIGIDAFLNTSIVFYGEKGSYIEEYCEKNGLEFIEE